MLREQLGQKHAWFTALAFKGGCNDSIWSSAFTKCGPGGAEISFTFLRPFLRGGSAVKNSPAMQEIQQGLQVQPLGQGDSLEKKIRPTAVFLPRKPPGQRRLAGYSPWACRHAVVTKQDHRL